jgi:nucleoside-diphosphate-sugar epimerase
MAESVLIIGGAGYIGLVLTDRLLAARYKVNCLDLLLYQNHICVIPYLANPNYRFIFGDLRDRLALKRALQGVTDVVLLAGLVGDPITKKYPEASHAINDEGILRCIDFLNGKGLDRVVFVSTCSNYGLIESDELADETYPLRPLSLYAKSKVAAEQHLLANNGKIDYTPTILRFATAFGLAPRMRFDLTVNEFTRELALGHELLVFDAHTWRPYCHVKDFARLIQQVIEAPRAKIAFEVFNAGGEVNNFTKQGIVDTILTLLPDARLRVRYQEQGADPRNYRVNFRKVRETVGFEPEYAVEYGVKELLSAIHEHVFDRVDLMRNFHGNYEIEYALT